jgi:hypothetical protein
MPLPSDKHPAPEPYRPYGPRRLGHTQRRCRPHRSRECGRPGSNMASRMASPPRLLRDPQPLCRLHLLSTPRIVFTPILYRSHTEDSTHTPLLPRSGHPHDSKIHLHIRLHPRGDDDARVESAQVDRLGSMGVQYPRSGLDAYCRVALGVLDRHGESEFKVAKRKRQGGLTPAPGGSEWASFGISSIVPSLCVLPTR